MQKRDKFADILFAVTLGLTLACLLAAYFDVLTK
jgi:hypothetical protein